jgi:hypothetical protein
MKTNKIKDWENKVEEKMEKEPFKLVVFSFLKEIMIYNKNILQKNIMFIGIYYGLKSSHTCIKKEKSVVYICVQNKINIIINLLV